MQKFSTQQHGFSQRRSFTRWHGAAIAQRSIEQLVVGIFLGISIAASLAGEVAAQPSTTGLARQAIASEPDQSAAAIAQLRAQGQAGLQTFLKTYASDLNSAAPTLPAAKLRAALDSLCQQRDCYASRLYWYTDLEQAKAAAKASNKPILSLHLLGKLNEELSCANSRFFRVALYPNAEISRYLQDHFILHWRSVRPVPKVTIDFGDGRKLERTVTGNSIHYILDAAGRPVDALPGLYGPQAFLRHLQQAAQLVDRLAMLPEAEQTTALRQYHRDRLDAIQTSWAADLRQLGIAATPILRELPALSRDADAQRAGQIAYTKSVVESPLLTAMGISKQAEENRQRLSRVTDTATWLKLTQLNAADARLDRTSQALMRSKNPAYQLSTSAATDPLLPVVKSFEAAMALDTIRNEYLLHTQVHQWFIEGTNLLTLEPLNERVYTQLFLTPSSDPWLGLVPSEVYSAIEGNGVSQ